MDLPAGMLAELLECWPVGRLATITPDDLPHVLPVLFVQQGEWLYSPVDGKRKDGTPLARVRNVAAHGRASLLLDHYGDDWSRLWWVRLEGPARVVEPGAAEQQVLMSRLAAKYPQYATVPTFTARPRALAMRPERVVAWSQSGDIAPIEDAIRERAAR